MNTATAKKSKNGSFSVPHELYFIGKAAKITVIAYKLACSRNLFKLFQNDIGLLAAQYAEGYAPIYMVMFLEKDNTAPVFYKVDLSGLDE